MKHSHISQSSGLSYCNSLFGMGIMSHYLPSNTRCWGLWNVVLSGPKDWSSWMEPCKINILHFWTLLVCLFPKEFVLNQPHFKLFLAHWIRALVFWDVFLFLSVNRLNTTKMLTVPKLVLTLARQWERSWFRTQCLLARKV